MSALSVPEPKKEIDAAIRSQWAVLQAASAESLPMFRRIPDVQKAIALYNDEQVLAAIEHMRAGGDRASEPLRTTEYRQFTSAADERSGEVPGANELFFVRRMRDIKHLPRQTGKVVLAHKLREVRAQVGFTRIEPVTPDMQGEYDIGVRTAALALTAKWLPASEVRGEGVFFELDEEAVRQWETRPAVIARSKELRAGYEAWAERSMAKAKDSESDKAPVFPGARFYLLHSLAHLLSAAISLECGYPASAIHERLYCAPAETNVPMAAILLSTGTAGTEGTLGGLVEEGRVLHKHLGRAWDMGVLCSSGPVCAHHSPNKDPAERFLEGAACHGCLFIAECSCEWFNRYLDRALVVPTLGHAPELAFFQERP